ncbi:MAG TPA: sulfotransferase, partial [Burkholderiales bacterium]|nr:sulfotransferase [Burkholderiales bacterium]
AFLDSWLGQPARAAGRDRWGLKEVRLTADHARYLQWLFPKARFLFLYRDVLRSWASCRHVKWFSVWPGYPVARPASFAHHWRHLVQGFREAQAELGAQLLRYEDLVDGTVDLDALASWLGTERLDAGVLDLRLGARSARRDAPTAHELAILHAVTDDLRRELGYD